MKRCLSHFTICSLALVLAACGGGGSSGSNSKSSSSSSVPASSSSLSSSSSSSSSEAGISSSAPPTSSSQSSSSSSELQGALSSSSSSVESSSSSSSSSSSAEPSSSSSSSSSAVELSSSSVSSSVVASSSSSSAEPSSSSSSSSVVAVAKTGVFVDSAVAGVTYETSPGGFTGVTSATGQYQYAEGDTVVFSIGEIKFPEVVAKGVVTPVDMAASGSATDPVVVNIAVLLQSLDADGNPANGITIPAAAVTAATQNVDFTQAYSAFAAEVLPVVQHTDTNKAVVSDTAAVAHLEESIAQVNASSLVGTWYIHGQGDGSVYDYVLFIIDDSHYAAIDHDSSVINGAALEIGTYSWDQATGKVTVTPTSETESGLDAVPPMANNNTLVLDGDTLTLSDADDEFVLTRLKATAESPLQGGWSFVDEEAQIFFAFTGTHYFMGQQSPADDNGWPGVELGTYIHNSETNAFVVDTELDTNGQWGASHPCAVLGLEESNDLSCGPGGRDIVQTFTVTGDALTFISEADTIKNGEEEPFSLERVNGLPDGDIHLKLHLTLTLTDYSQGTKYERDNGTMQCDLDGPPEIGETETTNESWVLGSNPNRKAWVSTVPATYNPSTKKLSFDLHENVKPVPNHPGFFEEFWDTLDATYNEGENHVITGTYTEKYSLTWTRNASDVSTCIGTYSVIGELR